MEYSLEVTGLTKHFEGFCLDHVTFRVKQGSIMGFIGENGAGKSTTIKSILNLLHPEEGTIKILGKKLDEDERNLKEQIGVVFDENHLHETLNAKDVNLLMSKIYSNWDSQAYWRYLSKFKLPEKKAIKEYSRGMKMKLSIAIALSHQPKLLILDEATSGLDPVIRTEILDVFYEFIQNEEHSILMSSHITGDLEQIADYITFIQDGKIVFSESKETILEKYGILRCTKSEFPTIEQALIAGFKEGAYSYDVLVKDRTMVRKKYPKLTMDPASLEEIMLYYGKGGKS